MNHFIKLRVKNYVIFHGYDAANKEMEEKVSQEQWIDKIVALDRILSVSEKYVLTTYGAGRLIYWEYEGGLKKLSARLKKAKALI